MAVAVAPGSLRPGAKGSPMRYQYKLGGIYADLIEGVIKGGADAYQKNKEKKENAVKEKIAKADKAAEAAGKKKEPEPGLIDRITAPIKDAAKKQAQTDITRLALYGLVIWLLLKK